MRNQHERDFGQSVDWKLVICYLVLIIIGWVNVYASIHSAEPASIFDLSYRCGKQTLWIITGFILAAVILFAINPGFWQSVPIPLYLFVLALLVAVIFFGIEVKGSRSWFEFGPVRFQPAEISKISTSLMLAMIMSRNNYKITKPGNFLLTAIIIGLPMLVILAESETGSALVYVGFIFMLYREGLSGWYIMMIGMAILLFILTLIASPFTAVLVLIGVIWFCNITNYRNFIPNFLIEAASICFLAFIPHIWGQISEAAVPAAGAVISTAERIAGSIKPVYLLIGIIVLCIPFLIYKAYKNRNSFILASILSFLCGLALIFSTEFIFNDILQEHQRKRIEVLLGMKDDPTGVGYNVNQSMIAIGSGGLTGKGFLNGTQTSYGFVPEQSTDFIFCTIGEEWGFIGCAAVILLYIFMIWEIISDAERSRDPFTRIYGYCVACCIFMHLFINIGMTIGLIPVIGIPLPFLSYGGSSLWSFTVLLFIFIALYREEKKYF
ncbi:MAG: rod shape-determining protein RodA [Bacteroidales bacterium]|jgi:rod shape determining protein RodA|nr:rod shape-determining protein RodA [Bacteroidales bacterium]MCI1784939.1 rod shape-determining protein RodA [Bacteroidales bacterium]